MRVTHAINNIYKLISFFELIVIYYYYEGESFLCSCSQKGGAMPSRTGETSLDLR